MPTTATPVILQDAGYLFWAPLATTLPTNTVVGSKFTDAWPVGFISLGATEDGSEFTYETNVESAKVAEFFDPIKWSTTDRSGNFSFNLASHTLTNWKTALNGGAVTIVSGTGATQLNKYEPPAPGAEVRAMIGWESLDGTMRIVAYQCINSGTIRATYKKAPAMALIPCQFNFEIPVSPTVPFSMWTAGLSRA